MPAELWGLLAGILAVTIEIGFKRAETYRALVWWAWPGAIFINYAIYKLVTGSPSLPAAVVIFSTTTLLARVGASLAMGNPIGTGTWTAVGLMLVAVAARMWRP